MCTIILRNDAPRTRTPWVVAANRDECLERPSTPTHIVTYLGTDILTPRDEVYGGTWIGVRDDGLLVALTNRDEPGVRRGVRSRGLLVLDALMEKNEYEVAELAARTAEQYKPFHLITAGREGMAHRVIAGRHTQLRKYLPHGWHVITEQSFGAGADVRGQRLRAQLSAGTTKPLEIALGTLLGEHTLGDPFASSCVHAALDGHAYGTRSGFYAHIIPNEILLPRVEWHAWEGPTCKAEHRVVLNRFGIHEIQEEL